MTSDLITILGFIIGILGLVATLVGTYFTYISFINPITRFKKYLKNPENWEKFQGIENHLSFYRHKNYPNFQIVIDWDKELARDVGNCSNAFHIVCNKCHYQNSLDT